MKDLPGIGNVPSPPFLPYDFVQRTIGNVTSFDAGRGCPFQCSFCTIINVQGRKSRYRTPDSVEQILRKNWEQGVNRFFITDDNFARNKDWEAIYDRIIKLREEDGMDVRFMIQVDTLCHKIPNFIEKSRRAGVTRVFIGLENINPANLIAAKKRQNKITEYRKMLLDWKRVGIMTFAGYILGFPNDTPESIKHDLEIIKRELPLDMLEFFVLTPLPGSEDHKVLAEKGVWMDPDMNKYELEHVVTAHPKMSKEEWQGAYRSAWDIFYDRRASGDDLRRAYASGINIRSLMPVLVHGSRAPCRSRICIRCNGASSASNIAATAAPACRSNHPSCSMAAMPQTLPARPHSLPSAGAISRPSCAGSKRTRTPNSTWTRR